MRTNSSVSCIFSTLFSILLIISIFNLIQRAGEKKKTKAVAIAGACAVVVTLPQLLSSLRLLFVPSDAWECDDNFVFDHNRIDQSFIHSFTSELRMISTRNELIHIEIYSNWNEYTPLLVVWNNNNWKKKKRSKKGNVDKESNSFIKLIQVSTRHNHIQDQWRENENNNNRSALTNNCIKWSE